MRYTIHNTAKKQKKKEWVKQADQKNTWCIAFQREVTSFEMDLLTKRLEEKVNLSLLKKKICQPSFNIVRKLVEFFQIQNKTCIASNVSQYIIPYISRLLSQTSAENASFPINLCDSFIRKYTIPHKSLRHLSYGCYMHSASEVT